jgi:hypothetical protein
MKLSSTETSFYGLDQEEHDIGMDRLSCRHGSSTSVVQFCMRHDLSRNLWLHERELFYVLFLRRDFLKNFGIMRSGFPDKKKKIDGERIKRSLLLRQTLYWCWYQSFIHQENTGPITNKHRRQMKVPIHGIILVTGLVRWRKKPENGFIK